MSPDRGLLAKEASRKAVHIAGIVVPLAYYFFMPRGPLLAVLGLAVLAAAVLEYVRLAGHPLFPRALLREREEKGVPGSYFYAMVSSFLAVLLFDRAVAVAALLFLDVGDAVTGMAGAALAMRRGPEGSDRRTAAAPRPGALDGVRYALAHPKSPVLMAVMLVVCSAIGLALYPAISPLAIAAGALGAMVADAFPWRAGRVIVDDNLSIPLLAGFFMTLAALA